MSGKNLDSLTLKQQIRFWNNVSKAGEDECWYWKRCISNRGYGTVRINKKLYLTHRVAYNLEHGPIPQDKKIDHKCHNARCCNPNHLQAVTKSYHMSLTYKRDGRKPSGSDKTFCPRGHEYTHENTYLYRGKRHCKECKKQRRLAANPPKGHWELKKTHCPQGHPYSLENTLVNNRNERICRSCSKAKQMEYRKKTHGIGKPELGTLG